jgi:hypothetical protein
MSSPPEEEATSNADNDGSGWPEPPWSGWIETTGDALLILEAARRGLIPRVTRRLVDSERKMITSGSVFVFDEDESGIKRWTDGFIWSPSRILGNFLVWLVPAFLALRLTSLQLYRETDKRSGNRSKSDQDSTEQESSHAKKGKPNASQALTHGLDKHRERLLLGSLTNSHKFKVDGMIKKVWQLFCRQCVHLPIISFQDILLDNSGRIPTSHFILSRGRRGEWTPSIPIITTGACHP